MYALCNTKTSMITKNGIIETYVFYWVKIDIKNQKRIYRSKITSFTTKMLEGYANVLGVTDTHTFIRTYGQGFFIIDNQDGKIIATRKSIVKNNPDFKNTKAEEYHFMPEMGEVFVYDKQGYLNQLDLNTLKLSKKGKYIARKNENVSSYKVLDTYHLTKFSAKNSYTHHDKDHFSDEIMWELSEEEQEETDYLYRSHKGKGNKAKIHYIRKKNEKRYFVAYSDKEPALNDLKDDFINPKVITDPFNAVFMFQENPHFLVLHNSYMFCKPHEILVSRVKPNSETVWTHRANMLIHNPYFDDNNILFATQKDEKLYFFCCTVQSSNIISVSVTETATGRILLPPTQIKC